MGLHFCLLLCSCHSMCVSSWVISEIQSIPHEYLCFGHRLFPGLGETSLPDEKIPHSVSLKCHQEEVMGEEIEGGHKGAISSHLFPSSISQKAKSAQHRISKAEREARHERIQSGQGRECVWSTRGWGRNRKIKRNSQRLDDWR